MKRINKSILLAMAVVIPMSTCDTDEFRDLNIDPNALSEINMNYLFTAAELSAGGNKYYQWTNIEYCAYWMQHLAWFRPGDKYFISVTLDNAPWEVLYGDPLKNLAEVLKQTGAGGFEEGRRRNTREAARILRAFLFHKLTDYYGNIPYFDALNGTALVFFPEYTHQSEIYADLLKELDEAAAAISTSNPDDGFADADLIYDGDIAKWKKWAYSLMLRLAMRASNKDPAMAADYATKAVAGGVFTSNADNVWVPMSETASLANQNGISRAFIEEGGVILSKTLIDKLKRDPSTTQDDDPRLMFISGGIQGNTDPLTQEGMPNGLDAAGLDVYLGISSAIPAKYFSRINTLLLDRDEPYLLMQYAEVEFLLAEAVERGIGLVPGTAKSHFEAGVTAAIDMFTGYDPSLVPAGDAVANYLADLNYIDGAPGALEMIGDQMWVSKWFNWQDAWADWRRTGFPVLKPVNYPGNSTNGTIPRKLFLPTHELATNAANVAASATKPDHNTARVWWDGGN